MSGFPRRPALQLEALPLKALPLEALLLAGLVAGCGDELHVGKVLSSNLPFRKVTLDATPGEPIALAVLPDRSVLHTTRTGRLIWHAPDGEEQVAATLDVYTHDEEGLQGVAIDPDYEQNGWVYLYYSPALTTPRDDPATPDSNEGDAALSGDPAGWLAFRGVLRLSRFRFEPPLLDLGSEQTLLEVPVDRGICCHVGGQIDFDAEGNLYLSTGDDTNPFESQGYTPIDERADRNPALDAQRSAANTNDLRGKLLRIRVQADGSVSIPEGNLFAPGTPQTRPEIYVMGLRNPFRFSVDREAGTVYLADYSPDATLDSPSRGPAATGKWMAIRQPGNYGWPYCLTPDRPYIDYDFASGASGSAFDCSHHVN
jgi:cytochrome c